MPDFEEWSPTVVTGVAPDAAGSPGTIALSNSRFAMIWSDATHVGTDKSGSGIFIQFYDAFGAVSGLPLQVNSTSPGDQIYVGGCGLVDGGAVVFWEDVSTGVIRAQRFSSAGQKAGAELLIDAAGGHGTLDVEGLPGGGFVVAWTDTDGQGMGVRAQVYSATGGKVGIERVVNSQTAGTKTVRQLLCCQMGSLSLHGRETRCRRSAFPQMERQLMVNSRWPKSRRRRLRAAKVG
jgi:hypothetical protein